MSAQPAYSHLRAERGGQAPAVALPPAPKMSYYDLQTRFWQLHAECSFKPSDSHLYFYLLGQFNAARWPEKLYRKRNQLAAELNLDPQSLDAARARLEARGLLAYVPGDKAKSAVWSLPDRGRIEGKNSLLSENSGQMEGNNSPSFYHDSENRGRMEGKNSPLYKEEEEDSREEEEKTPDDAACAAAPRVEKKMGQDEISPSALATDPGDAAHTGGGAADVATSITKRRLLLRDSPLATLPAFVAAWQSASADNPPAYAPFAQADLAHYHAALLDWSNAEGKTKFDWLGTIRGSMRRDADSGRLRRLGTVPGATPAPPSQVSQRKANSDLLRARYNAPR